MTDNAAMPSAGDLVGRLLDATVGAMDIYALYMGEQLGYYRALHEGGPATSAELASRTGTVERYTREWLEQQTTTGMIAVDDVSAGHLERRYELPAEYASVLVDPLSELFVAPLGRFLAGAVGQAPALLRAYRTGGGVSWSEFGDTARTAQGGLQPPLLHAQPRFRISVADSRTRRSVAPPRCPCGRDRMWCGLGINRDR